MAYGFKAGKNKADVIDQSQLNDAIAPATAHIADSTIHVTAEDKTNWDNKVGLTGGLIDRTLIDAGDVAIELILKANINNGETVSKTITASRALVVIQSGNLNLFAVYIKSAGVMYGIKSVDKIIGQYNATASEVSSGLISTGSYYKEATGNNDVSMSYASNGTGLSFTNTSAGDGCDVNIYIVELA